MHRAAVGPNTTKDAILEMDEASAGAERSVRPYVDRRYSAAARAQPALVTFSAIARCPCDWLLQLVHQPVYEALRRILDMFGLVYLYRFTSVAAAATSVAFRVRSSPSAVEGYIRNQE
jgi:hypothetical protein